MEAETVKKQFALGQLIFPESIPDSFWIITQGHGVIPDGRRFLVIDGWGDLVSISWPGQMVLPLSMWGPY